MNHIVVLIQKKRKGTMGGRGKYHNMPFERRTRTGTVRAPQAVLSPFLNKKVPLRTPNVAESRREPHIRPF